MIPPAEERPKVEPCLACGRPRNIGGHDPVFGSCEEAHPTDLARLRDALETQRDEMRALSADGMVVADPFVLTRLLTRWADKLGALLTSLPARPEKKSDA